MGNAIWLLLALPLWYFSSLTNPLAGGALTLIPTVGTFCLLAGVLIGIHSARRGLLLFFIPFGLSELVVSVAGLLRGQIADTGLILFPFVVVQLVLSVYLVFDLRGARIAASALAIFSFTYALFGAFVASMSFTDRWL
jgi:hypothetical protein